jgi:hypothetical protein
MVDLSNRDEDEMWRAALRDLQTKIAAYDTAKKNGYEVVKAIKHVADSHPDPQVRAHWRQKAEEFEKGDDKVKSNILLDIGKGLGILLITPFALAGAVIFGAGAIIYGVGSVIKGLGSLLTVGKFG